MILEGPITIEETKHGWNVRMQDRYAGDLTWDEMLGQVAMLTCLRVPPERRVLYQMMTEEEWENWRSVLRERFSAPALEEGSSDGKA